MLLLPQPATALALQACAQLTPPTVQLLRINSGVDFGNLPPTLVSYNVFKHMQWFKVTLLVLVCGVIYMYLRDALS